MLLMGCRIEADTPLKIGAMARGGVAAIAGATADIYSNADSPD